MFKPDNKPFPISDQDEYRLRKMENNQYSIGPADMFWVFHGGNTTFVRVVKIVGQRKCELSGDVRTHIMTRVYLLHNQREEFICDMFDISLNHKIVAVAQPEDIFLEETDENDTNIDADMIEAIVGKMD